MSPPLRRPRRWLRWFTERPARARWASLLGGAAASALLLGLYSRVEVPWFALGFVALVPWLLGLERAASWREALGGGALMSVAFVAAVFPWFPATVQRYAGASTPSLWLLMLVMAPVLEPQFVACALARHLARRAPGRAPEIRAALAAASAYVGVEFVLPKLFFDTLGQGLHPSLHLRQAADIAGVHGLTLLLVLVNEGVAATLRRGAISRGARSLAPLACALALLLAGFLYGHLRVAQVEARSRTPGPVVGLVQASITNYDRLRAEKGAFETVRLILDTHYALTDEILGRARPDLIVWPETVYPTTFGSPRSEAGAAFDQEIAAFVASRGVPLVFGAYEADEGREFNAAFLLDPSRQGRPSSASYRKRMLFPLTEWVPEALDSEWLRGALPWTGHWTRGSGPRVLELEIGKGEPLSVAPLICYDVLFPDVVAEAAARGAELIVTLSNDSWFPDERAPRLHLISAAFRSIETRLPQVRATNSGISAVITPTGEITATTRWDQRETVVATLAGRGEGSSRAATWGRWLGPALLVAALLLSLRAPARDAREPRPPEPPDPPDRRPRRHSRRRKRT